MSIIYHKCIQTTNTVDCPAIVKDHILIKSKIEITHT